MFSKILIANRGEIAVRVLRACRELGIATVAVYSEADVDALHVQLADESICIGPPPSTKSYLDMDQLIRAATGTGADAVHPGYGYLAENAEFARQCQEHGIVFIGPSPACLKLTGDKIAAKEVLAKAGVPVVPSSPGPLGTLQEALGFAERIGYPVLVKAAGGGGGRGIRVCQDEKALEGDFSLARAEAAAAFGNGDLYIEKRVNEARHIEFQVLSDSSGNTIHLGERECSIQRRYQKLIEEAPSPALSPALRREMGDAAIKAAKAVGYFNAGTVEFLLDKDGAFYFIEVNSRIQVEHPVTELVTGIDLVKEQIHLACGEPLRHTIEEIRPRGWAIECRINAENPEKGFLPCPGTVDTYRAPGGFGVRLDTHLYQGYGLPIFYDSLIAKLIAHGTTREGAIAVMKRALQELVISPIETTIALYLQIMDDPLFRRGQFDTSFIERFVPAHLDDD